MSNIKKQKTNPVKSNDFGLAVHKFQTHSAIVDGRLSEKELECRDLWGHVIGQLSAGDEVRCLAEDCSFRAIVLCTYREGSEVRMKTVSYTEVDAVDYDTMDASSSVYSVKMRGVRKWCIVNDETGEVIKELIPTQGEALKELLEYKKALAA